MRRFLPIVICLMLVALSGPISAQFLGQMTPASVIGNGVGSGGGYVIVGDHYTSFIGSLRYGMNSYTEGRLRLGLIDPDRGDMGVILGGDVKYQIWDYNKYDSGNVNPFDLAMGFGIEFANPENVSFFSFGGSIIGSIPITLKNKRTIEPYGRINFRIQHVSIDDFMVNGMKVGGGSDTELEVGMNFGAMFSLTDLVDFTVEVQVDDETAILLGVDLFRF